MFRGSNKENSNRVASYVNSISNDNDLDNLRQAEREIAAVEEEVAKKLREEAATKKTEEERKAKEAKKEKEKKAIAKSGYKGIR